MDASPLEKRRMDERSRYILVSRGTWCITTDGLFRSPDHAGPSMVLGVQLS